MPAVTDAIRQELTRLEGGLYDKRIPRAERDTVQKYWKEKTSNPLVRLNDTHLIMPAGNDGYWHTEFRRLPDTVDPRGPKGK